ncbi:MAG TPA: Type 1 glutamine amidotransferase-like domain-containing protein [Candidatus Nanoarchaeia archaeon]|nr:Type 1 glutamine amidotransferase-like domain-containing protein [Candidatus Nanoarchaeia archaeon]
MRKLFFLGGENVAKHDAKNVNSIAFQDAGGTPNVLVFPWARASFDTGYVRRKKLLEYFRRLGAVEVIFSDYSDSSEEIAFKIANADIVYLTGGQVSILASRMKDKGLTDLLRSYRGVIVGRSAGAMVMGQHCLVTNRYSGSRKIVEGLGFVDFSIKAHYLPSQDALLKRFSAKGKTYAIPHGSALIYNDENGALTFIGEVFTFINGEKKMSS